MYYISLGVAVFDSNPLCGNVYMELYVPRCVACSGSEGVRTNSHDKLINEQTYYPFGPVPRIFRARETTRRSASVLQSVAPWRLNSWDMVRMNWKRFFAVVVVVVHSLSWVGRSDYWHDYLGICSADGLRVDCVYSGICTTMCDEGLDVEGSSRATTTTANVFERWDQIATAWYVVKLERIVSIKGCTYTANTYKCERSECKHTWLVNVHTDPLSCLIYWK